MKRFGKLLLLTFLAVILSVFMAVLTSAENEPYAEIGGHNLSMEDSIYIMYYACFENVPENAETGILIFCSGDCEFTYGNQNYIISTPEGSPIEHSGHSYRSYYFRNIVAKQMTDDFYAVAYIKDGKNITYGELDKYSILQYSHNILRDHPNDTKVIGGTTIGELLTDILNYGASVQSYLNYRTNRLANDTYYEVKVIGGKLSDGSHIGLFKAGDKVSLFAKKQVRWTNNRDAADYYSAIYEITVPSNDIEYTANEEPFYFTLRNNDTYSLTKVSSAYEGELMIPRKYNGKNVTAIDEYALVNCTGITAVYIPNSVSSIGDEAFSGCTALKTIVIPRSVTSVGVGILDGCQNLSLVSYAGSYDSWASKSAFNWDDSGDFVFVMTDKNYDGSQDEHDMNNYYGYTLTYEPTGENSSFMRVLNYTSPNPFPDDSWKYSVVVRSSVEDLPVSFIELGYNSDTRNKISCVVLEEGITLISTHAFYNMTSLERVIIPDTVKNIEACAFSGCTALSEIIFEGTCEQWNAVVKTGTWNDENIPVHCIDGIG